MRSILCALVLFGFFASAGNAQDGKKDAPKSELEVDIHFVNGSTVRMRVHTEKVEIETIYGKLTIPARDIRTIEFGLHLPDGFAAKIESAVKKLGHSDFREREKAGAALLAMGPYSYAAALDASGMKETEISTRAKIIVQKLQAKFARKELKTSSDDKIITPTLTLTGRILSSSLKAKADYFGAVDLNLADMRTLRAIGSASGDMSFAIDAGKYSTQGAWLATGFHVDGRSSIVITAKCQVDLWPEQNGQFVVGPSGRNNGLAAAGGFGVKKGKASSAGGMLKGRIGESGSMFTIGEHYEGVPLQSGMLYLSITPSTYSPQMSGSYEVHAGRKTD